MLYNKDAVKNLKDVGLIDSPYYDVVKRYFEVDEDYAEHLLNVLNKHTYAKTTIGRLSRFCQILGSAFPHEEAGSGNFVRSYQGIRSAMAVVEDRTGHCIELNTFLYGAIKKCFPELTESQSIVIAKNPHGYSRKYSPGGFGIHPFVKLKIDDQPYLADLVAGDLRKEKDLACSCLQEFSEREYSSFFLADCAEDLALNHNLNDQALKFLNYSADLDPNQYPRFFLAATIRYNQAMANFEDDKKRTDYLKKMDQNLTKGISIAPGIMDTWKTAGDFYFDSYLSKDYAFEAYREAVKRPSKDRDMTRSFYFKLIRLGQGDLATILKKTNWNHLVG